MEPVTKNLPVIAMRGLNVFPRMNTSFDLERPISVHALERAMENGEEIFLVTQREIGVEQPEEKDLYEIGTVARVTQILRVSDRVLRVMMEGACRARLKRLWQREPFLQAQVELIDEPAEIPDAPDARVLTDASGSVQLTNVAFSYTPEQHLIENLNLSVKPGQRIAIVGPTGCGKTTLINLLMRFYDVNGGAIKVSGTDIRSVTRASLRGSYGMVLQDTWLRAGTVRENIAYGKPDATLDEVVAAAKAAHADSFIRRLPDGYDTVIAEDGGNISQGQKQLLCIARVMLCLPPMLILDEATSSIDTRTEVRIQAAFARMMQGRTSFIVAHRLSTIREADVILVMKDGHIVEQGDHDTLLAQGGFYAKLYNSQFEGVET